ncbi:MULTISPECIES: ATP synthase subunit I [unclassified Undibacterium]|uniref:ATP synthase subunit I n=1 Tax=unclassified Undibacterium TaxID=2630295 RepID=UPI002AC8E08F|nr:MULTISPECIES: ATP synthase subunit I [unclassified Undibacterium]MEB0140633.1 ATP synthase subunit I [Undibacterium sp. CCC2.1]MEB0173662.1 ATP synthase subunit I [Undibacterium sp. CCC1.1]MEB0177646.1 ATP synthase subunit I [Undibacterium sp. CCC3.4]MEB0216837.1 ATP synthase subunit I [Undibacterium sp. 5I2]WPX41919.1 ATP synthase subunit I [Undibacterium sp. CCC3.4]
MIDASYLTWFFLGLAGAALGLFFYGGLWWTLQHGLQRADAGWCLAGSFLLRTAVTLLGLYLIADGQWQRMLAGVLGFIVMRVVFSRYTLRAKRSSEPDHAT